MSTGKEPRETLIAAAMLILATGITGFWISFFLSRPEPAPGAGEKLQIYLAFEESFPPADLCFLVPALIAGATGLLRRRPYGTLFSLLACGGLIFLGMIDAAFNIRQGRWNTAGAEGVLNIAINAVCFFSGWIIAWRLRGQIR